jgi:hypothetical protein
MWEYCTFQSWKDSAGYQWSSGIAETLNHMGQQGWELVTVVEAQKNMVEWVFKRSKLAQPAATTVGSVRIVDNVA